MTPPGRGRAPPAATRAAYARQDDTDVALVIDATLDDAMLETARAVVARLTQQAGRLALIIFGDHTGCPGAPSSTRSVVHDGRPPFDVKVAGFSRDVQAQSQWMDRELRHVDSAYYDAALECALAAANDLQWRPEARRLLYVMGISLPHQSADRQLMLRTGVDCPREVDWCVELVRLGTQHVQIRAATVLAVHGTRTFLALLHRAVWFRLNGQQPPDALSAELPDLWGSHLKSA